ncbi:MFS transporter [Paenibacillus sp. RC84]|uniref:MFS transporter n=1 Tax=Paenibacillus sp. RC84 TaxID=3156252 RepID=UPI0035152C9F
MDQGIKKQTRARYVTVFATFLAFMGIGVVDPILPIIAEKIGANPAQIELLFTAYILTMAIMMIPSGLAATRFGDKKMMVAGLAVVTVFAFLCGASGGITELALFRAGWGFGNSMFFATAMTLLIALTPSANTAVGMYEAAIGLGMAGGPLVGGLLGGISWRLPFIATGCFVLIAFLLVLFMIQEPEKKSVRKAAGFKELLHLATHKPFLRVAGSSMFYYYGFFVVLAYSPLMLHMSAIQLGLVFFGWGLMLAYGSAKLAHNLEERFKPSQIIPWSLGAFCLILLLLFLVHTLWLQILLIIVIGLFCGLNNALFTSHVMEVSPFERSVTSGAYNFVRWLGAAIAPVLSGYIAHHLSAQLPFAVAAGLALIAVIAMSVWRSRPAKAGATGPQAG